ncbi:hypothetical protein RIR_jg12775.t1 [Rhizophagus irregularis DAOM 181602=DAOM 197198]|nr:hypothetical protein RIR_jg12775.t1 [Rhizophagus irregularis DAOM 181602=DAOM 197198]
MNIIEIKTLPLKLEFHELDSTAFPSLLLFLLPSLSYFCSLDMTFRFCCFSLEWEMESGTLISMAKERAEFGDL